jgi:hypothetical protein
MSKLFEAVASSSKETIVQARNWLVGHFEELVCIIYILLPYVLIKSHIQKENFPFRNLFVLSLFVCNLV